MKEILGEDAPTKERDVHILLSFYKKYSPIHFKKWPPKRDCLDYVFWIFLGQVKQNQQKIFHFSFLPKNNFFI